MLLPFFQEEWLEAGCDEAGRGCLAGPVFAAAVILPKDMVLEGLNDSKKLSHQQRMLLRPKIEQAAIAWAVGVADQAEIDEINILNASFLAMHRAIEQLRVSPESLLIDGNRFKKYKEIPHHCMVKGDGRYLSIAAASVLAKTYRDDFMDRISQEYPAYQWQQNKGYPTVAHRQAILETGMSPYHRKTFQVNAVQLQLSFEQE